MKAILEFVLPEDQTEFDTAVKAMDMSIAIHDIGQEVFRPARKHGYPDPQIANLLLKIPDHMGEDLIGLLEEKFYEILNERDVAGLA